MMTRMLVLSVYLSVCLCARPAHSAGQRRRAPLPGRALWRVGLPHHQVLRPRQAGGQGQRRGVSAVRSMQRAVWVWAHSSFPVCRSSTAHVCMCGCVSARDSCHGRTFVIRAAAPCVFKAVQQPSGAPAITTPSCLCTRFLTEFSPDLSPVLRLYAVLCCAVC